MHFLLLSPSTLQCLSLVDVLALVGKYTSVETLDPLASNIVSCSIIGSNPGR